MFNATQVGEAEAAARTANQARDRMLAAGSAFETAQQEFISAMQIAGLIFGPSPEEQARRQEFVESPLGLFIGDETRRLRAVYEPEAVARIKLGSWTTAFAARTAIAERFPVAAEDLHMVLAPRKGKNHTLSLLYAAERGIRAGSSWDAIMAKDAATKRRYVINLDTGQTLDTRAGMTEANYRALIHQVLTLDPASEIDRFVSYEKDDKTLPDRSQQPWLTGERAVPSEMFDNKRAAPVGVVREMGSISLWYPSTAQEAMVFKFRPGVRIA